MKRLCVLVCILWVAGCAPVVVPEPVSAPAPQETLNGSLYTNTAIGLQINFPEGWRVMIDRESADDSVRDLIPETGLATDSPMFVASRENNRAYMRCLVEELSGEYDMSLKDYFELVYASNAEELDSVVSAAYSEEHDAVQWTYNLMFNSMKLTYFETVFKIDTYAIRLTGWTASVLFKQHEAAFRELTESVQSFNNNQWELRLKGIFDQLSPAKMDFVAFEEAHRVKSDAGDPPAAQACPDGEKYLLWKIEDLPSDIYLFGSIHLGAPDFYPLSSTVENAFEQSDILVVESNMDDETNMANVQKMMQSAVLPEGTTIKDVISEPVYVKLKERLDLMGIPIKSFQNFKPWMVSLSISVLQMQYLGYFEEFGVENYFKEKLSDGQTIQELENPVTVLKIFQDLDGELYLAYTLFASNNLELISTEMIKAWKCGNEKRMENLVLNDYIRSTSSYAEVIDKLFYKRNAEMADRIAEISKQEKSCFVIVGAGHLVGDHSIISHLQQNGFKITRIEE